MHLRPEPLVQRGSRVDDSLHSAGGWRVRGGMAHYIATATTKQPDLPSNSNLPSPAPGLAAANCTILQPVIRYPAPEVDCQCFRPGCR